MSNRRRARTMICSSRRQRNLQLTRLEDRLAPAISIMGPHTPQEQQQLEDTGALAWTAITQLPTPTNLVTYYDVVESWKFSLDHTVIESYLSDVPSESAPGNHTGLYEMMIPRPDGSFQLFNVWEVPTMAPHLAAQFPEIKTYRGQGIDDPYATLAADLTPAGFHAQVLSPQGAFYLEPYYHQSQSVYIGYYKQFNQTPHSFFCATSGDIEVEGGGCGCGETCDCPSCLAAGPSTPSTSSGIGLFNTSNGATLRQYRLAVATTGEYTAFFGGTVALGQAAVVTAVNRVNQVYETELSVRMNLVANNSTLIYTDSTTDPYTNGDGATMLGQNQSTIDTVIGNANYDIGHVFSTGGGGIAGLGVVGSTGNKARGVTGNASPVGDSFWIDYVAHEMGHQFDGDHTFNSSTGSCSGNRSGANAYEQGSGSTIMAYAGICGTDDLQPHSDPYFIWRSLDQISTFISVGNGAGFTQTPTGNAIPVVDAGLNYTIPAQTPFALTGTATDANGDPLTYLWEEADLGPSTTITAPDNGSSPLFRSFIPSTSPTRTVPRLSNLLANTNSVGEVMASNNRTLNWRLTVFDNKVDGAFAFDSMAVTVVNTGSAFAVTSPNTNVVWQGLTSQTVTWNVAGTTGGGINAANVNILLSTDGGFTFPTTLAANVANDGSEVITIPNVVTSQARIRVQPTNNIFFDISNAKFSITAASPFQVASSTPTLGAAVTAPLTQFDVNFSADVKSSTVDVNDVFLSEGTVTQADLVSPSAVRYTIAGAPLDGALTLTVLENALTDNAENGNGQYIANITIDAGTVAFPTPLTAIAPVGSLAYSGGITGNIGTAVDTDSFAVDLEGGQTVTIELAPSASLRPFVSITGPGGINSSQQAIATGASVLLQTVEAKTAGTYTITVGNVASTTGTYTLQLMLNAAAEAEGSGGAANNTLGTAQDIAASSIQFGTSANRWAVSGRSDQDFGPISAESEPNNTTATANDGRFDFASAPANLYQMSLSGTIGVSGDVNDYYNIGTFQVGDIITISQSGSLSSRGTMLDPFVNLYRLNGGPGALIVQNDDSGVFNGTNGDALIYRFTVTVADTYYINAQRAGSTTAGTYQLGVWLENTGTAPNTGGTLVSEGTAANGTIATAENAASSWRADQYLSTINGSITAGDSDYYRFDFTAGDVVTFVMDSTAPLESRINLRNSVGTIIALENGTSTGPGTDSPIYGYRIVATGTYYLESLAASGTGMYSINTYLSSTASLPPAVVGNDFYRLPLAANTNLTLALDGQSAGTLSLSLSDAAGMVVATGADGPTNFDSRLQYFVPSGGNYFVQINGTGNVPYSLTGVTAAAFDTEPNDSFSAAQALVDNRVLGGITGTDDWYLVPAIAGQAITLTTSTPGDAAGEPLNNLDPAIELYDPTGALVGGDDNSALDGRNAVLSKFASMTGDYRARVVAANGTSGAYVLAASFSNNPPATVDSALVSNGPTQRSMVTGLTVTFSEVVNLPTPNANAFQLTRTGPGGPNSSVDVKVDTTISTPTQTIAQLTFFGPLTEFGSLIDGLYTFTIVGSQITDSGLQVLDGDNNGSPGSDFVLDLHRLFGDSNGDRIVSAADFNALRLAYGTGPSIFDFDASGDTTASDFSQFRVRYGVGI